MLVDLTKVEQRYDAVRLVKAGRSVSDVARQFGISRQSVHAWIKRFEAGGMAALADRSRRPHRSPTQLEPAIEAVILELRDRHGWGERRIAFELARLGWEPLPGRSSIYRTLVRNERVQARRRRDRTRFRSWERALPMALWQADIMRRVFLGDGTEVCVVNFIDDHSRFCVATRAALRATSQLVCHALLEAIERFGVPQEILTDNGKQFTARFSPNLGETMFDRICRERGIDHILTAVRSPTTTGKIERFHQTLRRDLFSKHTFTSLAELQAGLDAVVATYNHDRPHRSLNMRPPADRFASRSGITTVTRRVNSAGQVSVAYQQLWVGHGFAGELVEVDVGPDFLQVRRHGQIIRTFRRSGKEVTRASHHKVSRMS